MRSHIYIFTCGGNLHQPNTWTWGGEQAGGNQHSTAQHSEGTANRTENRDGARQRQKTDEERDQYYMHAHTLSDHCPTLPLWAKKKNTLPTCLTIPNTG